MMFSFINFLSLNKVLSLKNKILEKYYEDTIASHQTAGFSLCVCIKIH